MNWWQLPEILALPLLNRKLPLASAYPCQVITSKTDCFDHRMDHQVCEDSGVKANYYFYNITNVDQVVGWLAGPWLLCLLACFGCCASRA